MDITTEYTPQTRNIHDRTADDKLPLRLEYKIFPSEKGAAEAHVMLKISDPGLSAQQQFNTGGIVFTSPRSMRMAKAPS